MAQRASTVGEGDSEIGLLREEVREVKDLVTGLDRTISMELAGRAEQCKARGNRMENLEHTVFGNGSPGLRLQVANLALSMGLVKWLAGAAVVAGAGAIASRFI